MSNTKTGSIHLGGATITYREDPDANQDSYAIVTNAHAKFSAVIVADGLGSYQFAGEAARKVVGYVQKSLEQMTIAQIDFATLFWDAKKDLVDFASTYPDLPPQAFATTLLVIVESCDDFKIAYVGNGAIWHIRGNFNTFSTGRALPWTATNYLNPHTVQNEIGKEALYRLISNSADQNEATPTVLSIEKDKASSGDIMLACTDGLYSLDQVVVGKLRDGTIWLGDNDRMAKFYQHLDIHIKSRNQTLSEALTVFLENLKSEAPLDDDTTVAALISSRVFEFQDQCIANA